MNKKVVQSKSIDKKAVWWVGFFLFAITIYFNSKAQDPFNAPKFWVLLVGAAWLLGYLISYLKDSRDDFSPLIKKTFLLDAQ
jgi:hypothetical protein